MEGLLGLAAAAAAIDLHLGLPSASACPPAAAADAPRPSTTQPRSAGVAAIVFGLDLALLTAPTAGDWGLVHRVKSEEGPMSSGPPPLLDVVDLRMPPSTPRNQDSAPGSKRVKTEQPTTSSDADADSYADAALLLSLRFPRPARRAPRSRRTRFDPYPPGVAFYSHRVLDDPCDAVQTWVRAEVLPRHDLPGDLLLHYVGEKVLRRSDMNSGQARFLFPAVAVVRLRAFLSADEIVACGLDSADRNAKKEASGARATATSYHGVPVSVYLGSGAGCGVSELRLNTFHRSQGTVINGHGYRPFIWRCGLAAGHGVQFWAFRRPAHRLCFLIAKRDDVFCPPDRKGRS